MGLWHRSLCHGDALGSLLDAGTMIRLCEGLSTQRSKPCSDLMCHAAWHHSKCFHLIEDKDCVMHNVTSVWGQHDQQSLVTAFALPDARLTFVCPTRPDRDEGKPRPYKQHHRPAVHPMNTSAALFWAQSSTQRHRWATFSR